MIDTVFARGGNFLMTRLLSSDLRKYAVTNGSKDILYRDLHKANYHDFEYHCLNDNPTGEILDILHAEIYIKNKYELHQYVIWRCISGNFLAATLLNGDENFKIRR